MLPVLLLLHATPVKAHTLTESFGPAGWPQSGIGAEIIATIMETEAFDYLDAPVERICGADIPMPYTASLESQAIPQSHNVVNAAKRALNIQ